MIITVTNNNDNNRTFVCYYLYRVTIATIAHFGSLFDCAKRCAGRLMGTVVSMKYLQERLTSGKVIRVAGGTWPECG